MSILLITGDNLRHKYMVAQLSKICDVVGWIGEIRPDFMPEPPASLSPHIKSLFCHHFEMRQKAEHDFFAGDSLIPASLPQLIVAQEDLNGPAVHEFLRQHPADIVLSYGCHFIEEATMAELPHARFLNIHGGLSPWYRGTRTHFWPVYFLEPQMVGFTLHETQKHLDGGEILFQNSYQPVRGDTLHYIACRTTTDFAQKLGERLAHCDHKALPRGIKQKNTGRLFFNAEWRPEHLRLIYDFYNDAVVDALLDGEIEGRTVPLIDVFTTAEA